MNHYPSNVKEKLNSIILSMAEHHWLFSKNPGHDFTRQHLGKLLRTNSKAIVFSPAMGATLSMLPILILSRTIISLGLSTIKVTTTCT